MTSTSHPSVSSRNPMPARLARDHWFALLGKICDISPYTPAVWLGQPGPTCGDGQNKANRSTLPRFFTTFLACEKFLTLSFITSQQVAAKDRRTRAGVWRDAHARTCCRG